MALHRTFITLDEYEKQVVAQVRQMLRKPNGKLLPQSDVIRAIVRDYWETLLELRAAKAGPDSDEVSSS